MRIEISVKLRSNGYLSKTKNRSRTTSRTVIYGDEGNWTPVQTHLVTDLYDHSYITWTSL